MSDPAGLRCPSCASQLPSAFPGASIRCACGQRVEVPAARASGVAFGPGATAVGGDPHGGGPYRTPGGGHGVAPGDVPCPFCSNPCPALVRICPHCDVRLDNVRCQRCFSLQGPGAFACQRCGHELELEPLLDATDAPCPRCRQPLEVAPGGDTRVHECPRCGGMFVPREVLAEILCSAELGGALVEGPPVRMRVAPEANLGARYGAPVRPLEEVRYVPCPLCHAPMNRVNFGKVSGVIVDVCKRHGSWFDAGELTRIIAFASSGGLEKTRARELADKREADHRTAETRAQLAIMETKAQMESRLDVWDDFLRHILFG